MRISVALCTYNGEKYIERQLLSILNQTKPVDEVVVCDDGSNDATLELVGKIAESAADRIRVFKNKSNMGPVRNFEKAISLCSGNIIFLSDQDDIWMRDKVEKVCGYFGANPDKDCVFTNAELINSEGFPTYRHTLFDVVGLDRANLRLIDDGQAADVFATSCRATGATMAVRSSLLSYCLPFPPGRRMVHDEMIAMAAVFKNRIGYMEECLTRYRLHQSQTVGLNALFNYPPQRWARTKNIMMWHLSLIEPRATGERERLNFVYQRFWSMHSPAGVFKCLYFYISGRYRKYYPRPQKVAGEDIKRALWGIFGKISDRISKIKTVHHYQC